MTSTSDKTTSKTSALPTDVTSYVPSVPSGSKPAFIPADVVIAEPIKAPAGSSEAIENLLDSMKPQRRVLLGVLRLCETQQSVDAVAARINELQQASHSVFDAPAITAMLIRAGALAREGEDNEPEHIEIDGDTYWKPIPGTPVTLQSTKVALDIVAADDPAGRARKILEDEAIYRPLYARLLSMASAEEGVFPSDLGLAIDDDPLVQEPRRFALYFIDKMEQCECITWDGSWKITEIGKALENELSDMDIVVEA